MRSTTLLLSLALLLGGLSLLPVAQAAGDCYVDVRRPVDVQAVCEGQGWCTNEGLCGTRICVYGSLVCTINPPDPGYCLVDATSKYGVLCTYDNDGDGSTTTCAENIVYACVGQD